jgi:hypothetical protein
VEVRQWSGQDAQGDAAGLAPVADGVDVDQVAAEPEQLRYRQDVPGVRGGGDLRERGPLQRADLGSGRRVFEQQNASAGRNPSATPSVRTRRPASVRMWRCRSSDWVAVDTRE